MYKDWSYAAVENECSCCAFSRSGKCALGKRRPWNLRACAEYQPYCLTCEYPDWLCPTCKNRPNGYLKASKFFETTLFNRLAHTSPFECVWY